VDPVPQQDNSNPPKDPAGEPSKSDSVEPKLSSAPDWMAATPPGVSASKKALSSVTFMYLIRNLLSMMGLVGMGFFGLLFLFLVALEMVGVFKEESLYGGLITFILLPVVFSLSALLTATGMFWKWRHTRKHGFGGVLVPGHTRKARITAIVAASVMTFLWIVVICYGTYNGYHYTDSTTFCGLACHQVMEPEYTAYKNSVHARVNCVECHIGPGAGFFVKAKFTGLKQVWYTMRKTYKTPIETPINNLRPAQDTCEHCHWPGRFSGAVERVRTHYAADDENTPVRYKLLMQVGGGHSTQGQPGGVHWHVSGEWKVEYLATDVKRQDIPYCRVTYKDGRVEEFADKEFDRSKLVEADLRTMDCLDCHSRPSHIFKSPNRALDEAIDNGLISAKLPGIKRVAIKAFTQEYKTREEAQTGIDAVMDEYVKSQTLTPEQQELMREARQSIKRVYSTNFFPEHGVDYRAFIDNLGHFESAGCERCHDGNHLSLNGTKAISKDCNNCHLIVGQAFDAKGVAEMKYEVREFEHPEDPVNLKKNCSSCHATKKETGATKAKGDEEK
jgi:nitrate/TMAO reductase-like tetraheme cytochrome c subunit